MMRLKKMDSMLLFDKAIKYIINVLIIYIIVILTAGLGKTLLAITDFFSGEFASFDLSSIVTDILTFLVMIELFRSFIEYFKSRRIRLHTMLDPAIILIVRELIVKLYSHGDIKGGVLTAFGVLILCLGIIRTLAVCFSPADENRPPGGDV